MLKALIIDDDEIIRLFLKKLLTKKFRFDVVQAANGIEGLAMIQKETPDVVFLDVTMPLMDGVEVLEAVRNDPNHKNLPVIMLTAISEKAIVNQLMKLGIMDFILKPLDYDNTFERLQKIISKNRSLLQKSLGAGADESGVGGTSDNNKILIIDKDVNYRTFVSENLVGNFEIFEGETGADCLKNFLEIKPATVMISENLEIINEYLLVKKLRELEAGKNVKIVLCSEEPNKVKDAETFSGIMKKTYVPDVFQREFQRVVQGKSDNYNKIVDVIRNQIREDTTNAIQQTFSVMAQEEISTIEFREVSNIPIEVVAKADLAQEGESYIVKVFLIGAKISAAKVSDVVYGEGNATNEDTLMLFKDILDTIANRVRLTIVKKGFKLAKKDVSINDKGTIASDINWKLVIPFIDSNDNKFFVGVVVD